jgi:hypothetical protein
MSYAGENAGVMGRARLRLKHYSLRTERAQAGWVQRFTLISHEGRSRIKRRNDFFGSFIPRG